MIADVGTNTICVVAFVGDDDGAASAYQFGQTSSVVLTALSYELRKPREHVGRRYKPLEESNLRSSCHSQLAITQASKPMRSACGARLRRGVVSAPGSHLAFTLNKT
nr:hypothetical protein BDOA9_0206160 [Bradyrhizobium sp. DOA9]